MLGRVGLRFGMLFGVKVGKKGYQKTQQKHACKKVTRRIPGNPGKSGPGSYGPLKQFKDPPNPRTGEPN